MTGDDHIAALAGSPWRYTVQRGSIFVECSARIPLPDATGIDVERYIDHLEPTDRFGRFDVVEQATAAPGERRGD